MCEESTERDRWDPNDCASRSPRASRSNLTPPPPLPPLCTPATQAKSELSFLVLKLVVRLSGTEQRRATTGSLDLTCYVLGRFVRSTISTNLGLIAMATLYTVNPGLVLIRFQTTRPWSDNFPRCGENVGGREL